MDLAWRWVDAGGEAERRIFGPLARS